MLRDPIDLNLAIERAHRTIDDIGDKSVFDYDGGLNARDVASQAKEALREVLTVVEELVKRLLPEEE